MIDNMEEVTDYIASRGFTYLIYGEEDTWCSEGINPIRARIEDNGYNETTNYEYGECPWTFISIPNDCYTDTINTPRQILYEVSYDGKKLNDVYGVIRYSHSLEPIEKKITNWQEEFGE